MSSSPIAVSYIDIVSNSLLETLNHYDTDFLVFNKEQQQMLTIFILNNISKFRKYGSKTLILNTCFPPDNFRACDTKKVIEHKYCITEKEFEINMYKLSVILDNIYSKLELKLDYVNTVYHDNLDIADILQVLCKYLDIDFRKSAFDYLLVRDANTRYCGATIQVPPYLSYEIERMIRNKGIIL